VESLPLPEFTHEVVGSGGEVAVEEVPVGGPDRRELDVFSNLGTWRRNERRLFPYSAIGRVDVGFKGKRFFCTGTAVGPNLVLTAAHCLIDADSGEVLNKVKFVPNLVGTEPAEEYDIAGVFGFFKSGETYLEFPERDWVFLFTKESIGARYGWIEIAPFTPFREDETLFVSVAGYASHSHCVFGTFLCIGDGEMTKRSTFDATYKINTEGGSSGGPILYRGEDRRYRIVGIHNRAFRLERVNVGILSSTFYAGLQEAKQRTFAEYATLQNPVAGIVCNAHEHCEEGTFCSNLQGGKCFRCDACGRTLSKVSTFDFGSCPPSCQAPSGLGSNIDSDLDCIFARAQNSAALEASGLDIANSVCLESSGLCLDMKSCEATQELPESANPRVYADLNGVYVPTKFLDVFEVSPDVFQSFDNDTDLLARRRGYRAGVLAQNRSIIGLGSIQSPDFVDVPLEGSNVFGTQTPAHDGVTGPLALGLSIVVMIASFVAHVKLSISRT